MMSAFPQKKHRLLQISSSSNETVVSEESKSSVNDLEIDVEQLDEQINHYTNHQDISTALKALNQEFYNKKIRDLAHETITGLKIELRRIMSNKIGHLEQKEDKITINDIRLLKLSSSLEWENNTKIEIKTKLLNILKPPYHLNNTTRLSQIVEASDIILKKFQLSPSEQQLISSALLEILKHVIQHITVYGLIDNEHIYYCGINVTKIILTFKLPIDYQQLFTQKLKELLLINLPKRTYDTLTYAESKGNIERRRTINTHWAALVSVIIASKSNGILTQETIINILLEVFNKVIFIEQKSYLLKILVEIQLTKDEHKLIIEALLNNLNLTRKDKDNFSSQTDQWFFPIEEIVAKALIKLGLPIDQDRKDSINKFLTLLENSAQMLPNNGGNFKYIIYILEQFDLLDQEQVLVIQKILAILKQPGVVKENHYLSIGLISSLKLKTTGATKTFCEQQIQVIKMQDHTIEYRTSSMVLIADAIEIFGSELDNIKQEFTNILLQALNSDSFLEKLIAIGIILSPEVNLPINKSNAASQLLQIIDSTQIEGIEALIASDSLISVISTIQDDKKRILYILWYLSIKVFSDQKVNFKIYHELFVNIQNKLTVNQQDAIIPSLRNIILDYSLSATLRIDALLLLMEKFRLLSKSQQIDAMPELITTINTANLPAVDSFILLSSVLKRNEQQFFQIAEHSLVAKISEIVSILTIDDISNIPELDEKQKIYSLEEIKQSVKMEYTLDKRMAIDTLFPLLLGMLDPEAKNINDNSRMIAANEIASLVLHDVNLHKDILTILRDQRLAAWRRLMLIDSLLKHKLPALFNNSIINILIDMTKIHYDEWRSVFELTKKFTFTANEHSKLLTQLLLSILDMAHDAKWIQAGNINYSVINIKNSIYKLMLRLPKTIDVFEKIFYELFTVLSNAVQDISVHGCHEHYIDVLEIISDCINQLGKVNASTDNLHYPHQLALPAGNSPASHAHDLTNLSMRQLNLTRSSALPMSLFYTPAININQQHYENIHQEHYELKSSSLNATSGSVVQFDSSNSSPFTGSTSKQVGGLNINKKK